MFDLHQFIQLRIKKHRYCDRVIKLYPISLVLFNKRHSTIGHNAICSFTDYSVKCRKYLAIFHVEKLKILLHFDDNKNFIKKLK